MPEPDKLAEIRAALKFAAHLKVHPDSWQARCAWLLTEVERLATRTDPCPTLFGVPVRSDPTIAPDRIRIENAKGQTVAEIRNLGLEGREREMLGVIRCLECNEPYKEPPARWVCEKCGGSVSQKMGVIAVPMVDPEGGRDG